MTEPLRLMTLNTQLLPLIAGIFDNTVNVPSAILGLFPKTDIDTMKKAISVSNALLAIPVDERPHVIGLNEVFNEDGRWILNSALTPVWPHVVEQVFQADLEEDAGLMVFSRIPFRTLPGGGNRRELFFGVDAGDDTWASKGAVLVQVDTPVVENTTLVFTHLQASYLGDDQHSAIRAQQLIELVKWIDDFFGHDTSRWRNLVVAGDLNIRGDGGQASGEWFDLFTQPNHPVTDHLLDSWIEMRPPAATSDHDPGYTHRDRTTGEHKRLDYLCRSKPADDRQIVAHHMRIGHRNVSDHFALEGLFQLRTSHCQPATATEVSKLTPLVGDPNVPTTSRVYAFPLEITVPGGYHWIWIEKPGTYTFHTALLLDLDVYSDVDISRPLERIDTLDVSNLSAELQQPYLRVIRQISQRGQTFVCRTPLLVAVHSGPEGTSNDTFFVLEHLGDTPATAIALPAHQEVVIPFPPGQRLGANDTAWFRVMPRETLEGKMRQEDVEVTSADHRANTLELVDRALATQLQPPVTGPGVISRSFLASARDDFFAKVTREADDIVGQTICWHTPVTYLRIDQVFTVHISDETGIDIVGADEPDLDVWFDGNLFLRTSWDDADTGEDWPNLAQQMLDAAISRGWPTNAIGFSDEIYVGLNDPDGPLGAAVGVSQSHSILTLAKEEQPIVSRSNDITLIDTIRNGTYTVSYTLSRDP